MSLDTWVSLIAIAVFALALWRYMDKKFDSVNARFDKLEAALHDQRVELKTEFKEDVASLRQHVDNGFQRIDERLNVLEQRTYESKPTGTRDR